MLLRRQPLPNVKENVKTLERTGNGSLTRVKPLLMFKKPERILNWAIGKRTATNQIIILALLDFVNDIIYKAQRKNKRHCSTKKLSIMAFIKICKKTRLLFHPNQFYSIQFSYSKSIDVTFDIFKVRI